MAACVSNSISLRPKRDERVLPSRGIGYGASRIRGTCSRLGPPPLRDAVPGAPDEYVSGNLPTSWNPLPRSIADSTKTPRSSHGTCGCLPVPSGPRGLCDPDQQIGRRIDGRAARARTEGRAEPGDQRLAVGGRESRLRVEEVILRRHLPALHRPHRICGIALRLIPHGEVEDASPFIPLPLRQPRGGCDIGNTTARSSGCCGKRSTPAWRVGGCADCPIAVRRSRADRRGYGRRARVGSR